MLLRLHAHKPALGPLEGVSAVEGPGKATPVGPGVPVGCAVGDAVGADLLKEVGVYVGGIVGDAVGPAIDCWGSGDQKEAYESAVVRDFTQTNSMSHTLSISQPLGPPELSAFLVEDPRSFYGSFHRFHGSFHPLHESMKSFIEAAMP